MFYTVKQIIWTEYGRYLLDEYDIDGSEYQDAIRALKNQGFTENNYKYFNGITELEKTDKYGDSMIIAFC